jgi:hypothetical protein
MKREFDYWARWKLPEQNSLPKENQIFKTKYSQRKHHSLECFKNRKIYPKGRKRSDNKDKKLSILTKMIYLCKFNLNLISKSKSDKIISKREESSDLPKLTKSLS